MLSSIRNSLKKDSSISTTPTSSNNRVDSLIANVRGAMSNPGETLKNSINATGNGFLTSLNSTGNILTKGATLTGNVLAKGYKMTRLSSQEKPLEVKIDNACTVIIQARVAFLTALPFLAIFGASTASAAATVGTGGAAAIAIVFVIAVIVKIRKKTKGIGTLNAFLKMMTILFTQLLITNSVIMELSTLFNIQLNQSMVLQINDKLNNVTKLVLSLAPVVTAKMTEKTGDETRLGTLSRMTSNIGKRISSIRAQIVDNTHKFFNQDRLTAEILKEVNIINSLFIGLYTQLDFQLRETELVCIHDTLEKYGEDEKKQCTMNIDFTNYKIIDKNEKDPKKGEKKKMNDLFTIGSKESPSPIIIDDASLADESIIKKDTNDIKLENKGGAELENNEMIPETVGTEIKEITSYREAYLYWIKNSENYKRLKAGNMEEISNKLSKDTEGKISDTEEANLSNESIDVLANNVNTTTAENFCTGPGCPHGGGGTLYFFDDIRKMLLKNTSTINSFLTKLKPNRNARKTRKYKRVKKTRNGRKARKHTTVYKRKARKHTNTRKYK